MWLSMMTRHSLVWLEIPIGTRCYMQICVHQKSDIECGKIVWSIVSQSTWLLVEVKYVFRHFLPKHSPGRFLVMRIDQQHRQHHASLPIPSTRRHYPSPPAIVCTDTVIPMNGKQIMTWGISIASRNCLYDSWCTSWRSSTVLQSLV